MSAPTLTRDRRTDALGWVVADEGTATEWATFDEALTFLAAAVAEGSVAAAYYGPEPMEGPTCSLCDALGHGYPGGGPCPLEERGWQDTMEEEDRYGRR